MGSIFSDWPLFFPGSSGNVYFFSIWYGFLNFIKLMVIYGSLFLDQKNMQFCCSCSIANFFSCMTKPMHSIVHGNFQMFPVLLTFEWIEWMKKDMDLDILKRQHISCQHNVRKKLLGSNCSKDFGVT